MGIHSRRSDFEPPLDKEIKDTTLDEFVLDEGTEASDEPNPNSHAEEILRFYLPVLHDLVKPQQVFTLIRQSFTNRSSQTFSKHRCPIAVRLVYLPGRSRGIRVLTYPLNTDYRRRPCKKESKIFDHLDSTGARKDKLIEKKFLELSTQFGFKVVFYSKEDDAVLLTAEGIFPFNHHPCNVVIELAIAHPGKAMFRHNYGPPDR